MKAKCYMNWGSGTFLIVNEEKEMCIPFMYYIADVTDQEEVDKIAEEYHEWAYESLDAEDPCTPGNSYRDLINSGEFGLYEY